MISERRSPICARFPFSSNSFAMQSWKTSWNSKRRIHSLACWHSKHNQTQHLKSVVTRILSHMQCNSIIFSCLSPLLTDSRVHVSFKSARAPATIDRSINQSTGTLLADRKEVMLLSSLLIYHASPLWLSLWDVICLPGLRNHDYNKRRRRTSVISDRVLSLTWYNIITNGP